MKAFGQGTFLRRSLVLRRLFVFQSVLFFCCAYSTQAANVFSSFSPSLLFGIERFGFIQDSAAAQPRITTSASRVVIAAVGDLMCHDSELAAAKQADGSYNFESFFTAVSPLLSSADLTIGNLETVMAGAKERFTGYPAFNTPDEYATALKKAGFDILTTANNHSYDRAYKGIARTLDVLDTLRIPHTGTSRSRAERSKPLMLESKGIKFAILAYAYGLNQGSIAKKHPTLVNVIDTAAIRADLDSIRALPTAQQPDKIIACLHWGEEYKLKPNAKQRFIADFLFTQGVDVILGSHPHVVQTVERKKVARTRGERPDSADCLAVYSMGNFVSGQRTEPRETGVVVWLEWEKDSASGAVRLSQTGFTPTYVHKTYTGKKPAFSVLSVPATLREIDETAASSVSAKFPAKIRARLREALKEITEQFWTPDSSFKLYDAGSPRSSNDTKSP